MLQERGSACDPARPALHERDLISESVAGGLARTFKVLGNDTRLRMLHALARADELSVNEIATALGMRPQAVSNQLQRLAHERILEARRDGNRILYRVEDPCVTSLLQQALCLTEDKDAHNRTYVATAASD